MFTLHLCTFVSEEIRENEGKFLEVIIGGPHPTWATVTSMLKLNKVGAHWHSMATITVYCQRNR